MIEDDEEYKHGFAFGIENESCIKGVNKEVFPLVSNHDDYVKDSIRGYIDFAMKDVN